MQLSLTRLMTMTNVYAVVSNTLGVFVCHFYALERGPVHGASTAEVGWI